MAAGSSLSGDDPNRSMGGMAVFGKPTMRTGEPFRDLAAAGPDPFADEKERAAAKKTKKPSQG